MRLLERRCLGHVCSGIYAPLESAASSQQAHTLQARPAPAPGDVRSGCQNSGTIYRIQQHLSLLFVQIFLCRILITDYRAEELRDTQSSEL